MVNYNFYRTEYCGDSIEAADFDRLSKRASEQLARYEKIYRVDGDEAARSMAVCAMADALYYFEAAANGGVVTSSSIGSVSSSRKAPEIDVSAKSQNREPYRCASLYMDIYRGCGQC